MNSSYWQRLFEKIGDIITALNGGALDVNGDYKDVYSSFWLKLFTKLDEVIAAILQGGGDGGGGTYNHTQLINRDAANQHPIEAITGLGNILNEKAKKDELGTAAEKDIGDFASAAQGAKADGAQPALKASNGTDALSSATPVYSKEEVDGKLPTPVILNATQLSAWNDMTIESNVSAYEPQPFTSDSVLYYIPGGVWFLHIGFNMALESGQDSYSILENLPLEHHPKYDTAGVLAFPGEDSSFNGPQPPVQIKNSGQLGYFPNLGLYYRTGTNIDTFYITAWGIAR